MQCIKPILIKNVNGEHYIVPCGQCIACRLNKVRDWTIRLMHEKRYHDKAVFLTLTYNDENLPENGTLVKKHAQDYLKRLRKALGDTKIRYFLCGEYGEKFSRPHYHLLVYGIDKNNPIFRGKKYDSKSKGYYLPNECIWKNGIVYIGDVTYQSTRYVASYINKKYLGKSAKIYKEKGVIPEFTLMSRKPGIGYDFVNFIKQDFVSLKELLFKEKRQKCLVTTKVKFGIPKNSKQSDVLKKCSISKKTTDCVVSTTTIHLQPSTNVRLTLIVD